MTTFKKYAVSSLITFVTTFAIALLASWDTVTLETIKSGAVLGVLFTAARAGVKAILEYIVSLQVTK